MYSSQIAHVCPFILTTLKAFKKLKLSFTIIIWGRENKLRRYNSNNTFKLGRQNRGYRVSTRHQQYAAYDLSSVLQVCIVTVWKMSVVFYYSCVVALQNRKQWFWWAIVTRSRAGKTSSLKWWQTDKSNQINLTKAPTTHRSLKKNHTSNTICCPAKRPEIKNTRVNTKRQVVQLQRNCTFGKRRLCLICPCLLNSLGM